ncbi:winged helix-turn-helix transcriptional regulator [Amycolatopsis sp.]|uniref:winged helix-turn-helix transcriptional regulator n=1 Tax=Amycolatopsis sp. TaxID=37632 RepID=UPI002C3DF937|nr:winged helix-turn-helix transcriptional regulator [Amycolatopsis sp.]HVV11783.1 winged helix-turn-helix transcriptional regulator [Amycolatopsis sp.]
MADDRPARVISCPGAVELLDELMTGPRRFSELHTTFPRRVLVPALRALAAEGALLCPQAGSWDSCPRGDALIDLTDTGRQLAVELSDLDVWVAVYDRYLNG